jgi:hypothetical protein
MIKRIIRNKNKEEDENNREEKKQIKIIKKNICLTHTKTVIL